MRPGVRLALDIGSRRIGVARCDREGILAIPETTIDATDPQWTAAIARLVESWEPIEIVIGNPLSLRGLDEIASAQVRAKAAELREHIPELPIRLVDERLSTAASMRALRATGHTTRSARSIIDAAAAVEILQSALETERRTGAPAGESL